MKAGRALVGHTGFVGGNLARQQPWDARFNSSNFGELRDREFDSIWCAGIQAAKWWANANPEEDRARIEALLGVLDTVRAREFVLISTVDVFADPDGVSEADTPRTDILHSYGINRLLAEQRISARFPTTIVRLPALFGAGLKKNALFDLLTNNRIEAIETDSEFQFYDLERLSGDVLTALGRSIPLVHLVTEPVSVEAVARAALGREYVNHTGAKSVHYDVRTLHAHAFGGKDGYIETASDVLGRISRFARSWARA